MAALETSQAADVARLNPGLPSSNRRLMAARPDGVTAATIDTLCSLRALFDLPPLAFRYELLLEPVIDGCDRRSAVQARSGRLRPRISTSSLPTGPVRYAPRPRHRLHRPCVRA